MARGAGAKDEPRVRQAAGAPAVRQALNRERVLAAAVALADAEGVAALTMRRLAAELGIEAMSLYHHLPGKNGLLDGLVETVVAEVVAAAGAAENPDDAWRPRLRARFLAARQVMLHHPWAPGLIGSRATIPFGLYQYYDAILGIMLEAGFTHRLGHRALHTLGSLPLGFAQELFSPSAAGGSLDAERAEAEFAAMAAVIPNLTAMVAVEMHDAGDTSLGWCDGQTEFEFTLDLILDGFERARLAGA